MDKRVARALVAFLIVLLGVTSAALHPGCTGPGAESPSNTGGVVARPPARPARAPSPASAGADGDWVRAARDYANTRFSPLDQITSGNVSQLRVAWTFSTGTDRGHEGAPLVIGDTLYVVTPYPKILYALDLTRPGAPMKWSYRPETKPSAQGVACCDVVNRGAAFADGLIVYNTLDNQTVAVDARTGTLKWSALLGDINQGETITMTAPPRQSGSTGADRAIPSRASTVRTPS